MEIGRNLNIRVRNGEVETVQETSSRGVGFRVFVKGRMAFSSCNDFQDAALDNAIESAIRFASNTTPDENNVLPDDKGVTAVGDLYDPRIAQVSTDKKIGLIKKVEELAMKDPRITKSAGARYREGEGEVFLANSNGLLKNSKMSACSFGVSVVSEKGEQKSSGRESCSRRYFTDLNPPRGSRRKGSKGCL